MEITELKFDVVKELRHNENDKDSRQTYYDGKPVYRALVVDNKLRASGPLTNGDLPINRDDHDIKFFISDSQSCDDVHAEIKKIISK